MKNNEKKIYIYIIQLKCEIIVFGEINNLLTALYFFVLFEKSNNLMFSIFLLLLL